MNELKYWSLKDWEKWIDKHYIGIDEEHAALANNLLVLIEEEKKNIRMKMVELIQKHTFSVKFCGVCECGENKYDLITYDALIYPPVHEVTIRNLKPELLEVVE